MNKAALVLSLLALISPWALAQQKVTIPAYSFSQTFTIAGKATTLKINVPAQTVTVPAPTPTLPPGLTYSNGVLTVAGSISANSISLTGGSALPTSASGLYLLQLTGGFLQPVPYVPPYVPYTLPATTAP